MLAEILHQFAAGINEKEAEWLERLKRDLCYEDIEREVLDFSQFVSSILMGSLLEQTIADRELLDGVRCFGGTLAYRFVEYREITVRLSSGAQWQVRSPYFVKATPKRGRKKRGPNGRGCHLLLALLGFVGRCSHWLVSEVVRMALLCPSFEVAHQVLSSRGLCVDVKTIQRLCRELGELGLEDRGGCVLEPGECVTGKTVVVGIDGGRLRLREKKRGRKRTGLKRQGYHTPWREPKLFTIYVLDEEGKVDKSFRPLHDATLGNADETFDLLVAYLRHLGIEQAAQVIITGDGAGWIWNRIALLREQCCLSEAQVVEVVDYFHATQHLWKILELRQDLNAAERQRLYQQWKGLLWQGDIEGLKAAVEHQARGKARREMLKALSYFFEHASRMQYRSFKAALIPQGSGSVESAIRRIINLRLKAPGIFWKAQMAECFLFLRSQLLAGRWAILMSNIVHRRRTAWKEWKDKQPKRGAIIYLQEHRSTVVGMAA